jgi:hypothetical protein
MEVLSTLVPYAAYAGVVGAMVVLVNRVFDAGEPGLDGLFRIDLDPPRPHGLQEEEPARWNVERLHRPTPADASPAAASTPVGVVGVQSAG